MHLDRLTIGKRLRFHHLELICQIDRAGGLGAPADHVHLTRAAVSKSLREIERALGVVLFERSPQGLRTTAAGRHVVQHAQMLLHSFQHLVDSIGESDGAAPRGLLRVGISPHLQESVVPLISRLGLANPGMETAVRIKQGWLSSLIDELISDELDVAISLFHPPAVVGMDLSLLTVDTLGQLPMVVVAPRQLRLPRGKIPWQTLTTLPWILPPGATRLRQMADEMFTSRGCKPPTPIVESSLLATNVELACSGIGLTVAPANVVRHRVAQGWIREVSLREPLPSVTLTLMHRQMASVYFRWIHLFREQALVWFEEMLTGEHFKPSVVIR